MSFQYNNIEYKIVENVTMSPLYRQNAMTVYEMVKPNILGMKEYKEDLKNQPYMSYCILCKVNNFLEWVEVDKQTGDKILNNMID